MEREIKCTFEPVSSEHARWQKQTFKTKSEIYKALKIENFEKV